MFLAIGLVMAAAPVPADQFEKQVAPARQKAVAFLLKAGGQEGRWNPREPAMLTNLEGGIDALVTLALLEAGATKEEKSVAAALARFAVVEPKRTYAVALQTAALAKADPRKYTVAIQRNADWLLKSAVRDKDRLVGWSYPFAPTQIGDGSNTQFALLGLSAAADAGAKVDPKVWTEARELYVRTKLREGWPYTTHGQHPPTCTMTAAALCGLLLADKHLKKADEKAAAALKQGAADWVKMYPPTPVDWTKPGKGSKSVFYQWYGTARLGRLGAKLDRPDGTAVNWYQDGATWLLKNQAEDGSWAAGGEGLDKEPVLATSFALLFLGPPRK